MNDIVINDIRMTIDFKGLSFSKFKKVHVIKELLSSLINSKVEPACYWCGELICAGHYVDIWEIIILFTTKYIHLGSPKLPLYISLRMGAFKDIVLNGCEDDELTLRNNHNIRHLFAEIVSTLCYSRKNRSIESVKIKKKEEFSMDIIQTKLKAPNVSYAGLAFRAEDPKELFVSINELSYHLSNDSKNSYSACYWLDWLIEFDNTCRKNKLCCISEKRSWPNVAEKYQRDSIWIVWEIITSVAQKNECAATIKIIQALLDMFCLRYTTSAKKKRRYILYNCISLLTDSCDLTIPIWRDKAQILCVSQKINVIYKEIKKNEVSLAIEQPNNTHKRSNLDKTKEKLDLLNATI